MKKTLDNTTTNQAIEQVSDLKIWGDGNMFKLLCKASSEDEGWMKSTKAMEISGVGCVIQVTTQQLNGTGMNPMLKEPDRGQVFDLKKERKDSVIAEALTFVPGVKIEEIEGVLEGEGIISRRLVSINYIGEGKSAE